MDIEFSGYYNKDIYYKTIGWIYRPSNRSIFLRITTFFIFGALYAATTVNAFQTEGVSSFEITRIFRHLIPFLILGYIVVQPYINSYRKSSELWKDPEIRRKLTGRVSTIGVIIDPMKDWLIWDKFVKVHKTPEGIALLTASRMFFLLQRDFFANEQDWKMIENIVAAKVQEVIE